MVDYLQKEISLLLGVMILISCAVLFSLSTWVYDEDIYNAITVSELHINRLHQ